MTTTAYVYTMSRIQGGGSWSFFEFPIDVNDWAIHGEKLYLRSGDAVYLYDDDEDAYDEVAGGAMVPYEGIVQWPWLEMGAPGVSKEIAGFDIVASGNPRVSVGYDQRDQGIFTESVLVPEDTPPDQIIPMSCTAPAFSMKITFDGTVAWQLLALNVYLIDRRPMT